jgi:transcriptional regulator with XRE-family HTH domain
MATTLHSSKDANMAKERSFFAERLREMRLEAGLTQRQLAQRAMLSLATIRHFEQGRREPTFATLLKVCQGLDMPLAVFEPKQRKRQAND